MEWTKVFKIALHLLFLFHCSGQSSSHSHGLASSRNIISHSPHSSHNYSRSPGPPRKIPRTTMKAISSHSLPQSTQSQMISPRGNQYNLRLL